MTIRLQQAGKRYNRQWIFRGLDYTFQPGNAYAITGPNGSGKSTLLQVIAGTVEYNEGRIDWLIDSKASEPEQLHRYYAMAAPYLEVVEEMTLLEFLEFHFQFKPLLPGLSLRDVAEAAELEHAARKQIRYYSSGMKQRVKLAQAFFSDVPVLLLDEPTSNLDRQGIDLYHRLLRQYSANRTLIICSNEEQEISMCIFRIHLPDYTR